MANGFLTPFLTGALGEYTRQEAKNDEIIGNIIDNVSNQVLNKEIPAEQALLKDALRYKKQYEALYGPEVAGVLDAANVFGNPTDAGVENALIRFFGTKEYNLDDFKTKQTILCIFKHYTSNANCLIKFIIRCFKPRIWICF